MRRGSAVLRCARRGGVLIATVLLLSGCGTDATLAGGSASSGESLAEMSEVTLRVQSAHPPDAAASRAFDTWKEAVERESGGKIRFEMFYSGALAPLTEVEEGLAAGLVDIATHAPVYNPAQFPLENVVQQLNSVIAPTPLAGTLQGLGAQTELALDDVYPPQFTDQGIQPLLLPAAVVPAYHLACAGEPVRSLQEAAGKRVRVPSEHLAKEAEAIGMTPTAMTISELFEAMQRGVVDCTLAAPQDIRDLGLLDIVDHWMIDPQVMWTGVSSFHLSTSKSTWDSLPVAAQRLLWDTAGEVFLPALVEGFLADTADTLKQAQERDISFHEWNDDVRDALRTHQERTVASAAATIDNGDALVSQFLELHEAWLAALPELGYDASADTSFRAFADAYVGAPFDLSSFIERIQQARSAHRP